MEHDFVEMCLNVDDDVVLIVLLVQAFRSSCLADLPNWLVG